MRALLTSTVLLLSAALAGCVGGKPQAVDPAETIDDIVNSLEGYVDPFILDHDHSDPALHDLAFHTTQLAHHALGGNTVKSSGAHVVDVQGDYLFVGAYGLVADVDGGVWIFDIQDREKPTLKSVFRLPGNVGGDRSLEVTDDANWIVLGTEAYDCANHVNPFAPGLFLIDARDKANPKLADYKADPGVHSVIVHRVDGLDYAVTLGGDLTTQGRNVWLINTTTSRLVPVGSVAISHDGAAYDDPVLGMPLLYLTQQNSLKIYDFSDPREPARIAEWVPPNVKEHYVHAVTVDWIEGQRIIAVESEDWGSAVSPLWVLNATDLDAIELMYTWTNPANAPADPSAEGGNSLAFSTHNPRFEDGILYMAHYHAGAWILDLRTLDKAAEPELMGYFLPHEDNGGYKPGSSQAAAPLPANPICFGGFAIDELPNTMDVEVKDGIAYLADLHTGLYAVKWDPTVLPDAT